MRTVRILDLRREHLRAEFVPKLRVESFHRSDSEGCTIVIIERHSPDRFSTGPLYVICALYAHAGWPPPESSCSIEPITACLLHQEPSRLGSRLEFWRTTGMPAPLSGTPPAPANVLTADRSPDSRAHRVSRFHQSQNQGATRMNLIDLNRSLRQLRLGRSEEHTSELQSHSDLVCRLLLEKKKKKNT